MTKKADRRRYHFIYRTDRLDGSGKFYVGAHSTDDLADGYLGSGKRLARSVRRHGRDAHRLTILEHLPTRRALMAREAELVTEALVADPLCMNLKRGGSGGAHGREAEVWARPGQSEKYSGAIREGRRRMNDDPSYRANLTAARREQFAANAEVLTERLRRQQPAATLAAQSQEARAKRRETLAAIGHQRGERNSQHGSRWVHRGGVSKKISGPDLAAHLDEGWQLGRAKNPHQANLVNARA